MIDRNERLKPASYMDIAQEMAVNGSEEMQATDRELLSCGMSWVITRMHVKFFNMPRRWDTVTAQTWHKGMENFYFLRDCRLLDKDGNVCVASTGSWIVMNVAKRKLVRLENLPPCMSLEPQDTDNAIEESCPKLNIDKSWNMTKIGERRVSYSDLDYNKHANNTKYTVWVMDCLPDDLVYEKTLKEICLNFNHEACPGTVVEFFCHTEGNEYVVEGRSGSDSLFVAKLIF